MAEILLNLDYCVELETPKLERSGGSMGCGASGQARSAEVQTGLAHLYKRISDEVRLKKNVDWLNGFAPLFSQQRLTTCNVFVSGF